MMRYEGFEALMKMIETVGEHKLHHKDNTVFIAKEKIKKDGILALFRLSTG